MHKKAKRDIEIYEVINSLSPYIRRAWDHTMPLNWSLLDRIIFDYELLYIMEGEAIVTIDKIEYIARPGDLFLIRPLAVHSIQSIGKTALRQPHIHFDFFFQEDSEEVYIPVWSMPDAGDDYKLAREDITDILNIPDKITLPDTLKIEQIIFSMIAEDESATIYSVMRQKAHMLELLAYIMEESSLYHTDTPELPKDASDAMEVAKQYISKNVNKNLHMDELVKKVGFSRNHLCNLFRLCYGSTPMQFHLSLRMDKAKYMLSVNNWSVTEVAAELGFDSIHAFSRVFKRETGVAPLYFKQISILNEEV